MYHIIGYAVITFLGNNQEDIERLPKTLIREAEKIDLKINQEKKNGNKSKISPQPQDLLRRIIVPKRRQIQIPQLHNLNELPMVRNILVYNKNKQTFLYLSNVLKSL